jgi:hypothetical protein
MILSNNYNCFVKCDLNFARKKVSQDGVLINELLLLEINF